MKFLPVVLLLVVFSFASNIITYVGVSPVSQDDANNAAVAGIAKQIVANVSTTEKMVVEDVTVGHKSSFKEKYSTEQNVDSDITLKWVKIESLPKNGNNYRAKASLDVAAVTSAIKMRLNELRAEIDVHEKKGFGALENRQLKKAEQELVAAISKVFAYNEMLDDLNRLIPLDQSLGLQHNLHDLEARLISKLSSVKLVILKNSLNYENGILSFDLNVEDSNGPLGEFPIVVYQNKGKLTTKQTLADGVVHFELNKFSIKDNAVVLNFYASFSEGLLNNSGLNQGIVLNYKIPNRQSEDNKIEKDAPSSHKVFVLNCPYTNDVCVAVKDVLKKNNVFIVKSGAPSISFSYDAKVVRELKTANATIVTYDFLISIEGGDLLFYKNFSSAAKTKESALINVIKKIKF